MKGNFSYLHSAFIFFDFMGSGALGLVWPTTVFFELKKYLKKNRKTKILD